MNFIPPLGVNNYKCKSSSPVLAEYRRSFELKATDFIYHACYQKIELQIQSGSISLSLAFVTEPHRRKVSLQTWREDRKAGWGGRWVSVAVVESWGLGGGGACLYPLCTNKANDSHLASELIPAFLLFHVTKLPGHYSSQVCFFPPFFFFN